VFPEKYDGTTPLPVLFGFHGCGGGGDANGTPYIDIIEGTPFETDYVLAAPVSSVTNCYDYKVDMPKAKALFTELVENYCVDMSRVFATGHSYGAGGMVQTLTASSNVADFEHFNFKAIVPVAGWGIFNQSTVVPTMYIQGVTDAERDNGDGHEAVEKIVEVNGCDVQSAAYPVDACNSSHDGAPVNAGCKSYTGCDVPTIWCSHDDSSYGGTFHGIPCFYQQAMYDFFESL
jgi:poly(3-hydroxybutyrate) depolymerase